MERTDYVIMIEVKEDKNSKVYIYYQSIDFATTPMYELQVAINNLCKLLAIKKDVRVVESIEVYRTK